MSEEEKSGFVPPPSTGHEIGVMFGFIGKHARLASDVGLELMIPRRSHAPVSGRVRYFVHCEE